MTGDFEQQRVKLATGVELDVVDIGPRDAPVLIFLHGFPESHRPGATSCRISRAAFAASRPTSAAIAARRSRRMPNPTPPTS